MVEAKRKLLLKELFYEYDHLYLIVDDGPSTIESFTSSIGLVSCGKNIKHEYPLGIKNYNCIGEKSKYAILMKEEGEIKGYAIFSIHELLIEGEIKTALHLSDLRVGHDLSDKGKREWKNAFLKIVTTYQDIEEFKYVNFFYTLLVEENISSQNMIDTWRNRINIKESTKYDNINIFGKKVKVDDSKLKTRYATMDDLESIKNFLQHQSMHKSWSDTPEYPPQRLEEYIEKKRCIITLDEGTIVGHTISINLDMRKAVIDKMSSLLKLAGSFLPLFDKAKMKNGEFIDSTHLKYFEADYNRFPLDRVEIFKQIINFVLNNEAFKKRELITFNAVEDMAIKKASESFLGINVEMTLYEITPKTKSLNYYQKVEKQVSKNAS